MKAELIATLTRAPGGDEVPRLARQADLLEVRGDLAPELDADELRRGFSGRLLFTLRSEEEGGRCPWAAARRRERLLAAAGEYDLVDLEAARDMDPELLRAVPPEKRLLSWHGPGCELEELREVFAGMAEHGARAYKLVPRAESVREALTPLALLHSLGRPDVVAFAGGEVGSWTRLLAPRLGAPLIFAAAFPGEPAGPGQMELHRLLEDYGLPELPPLDRLYGIVGSPARRSLSPRLHNALYRHAGFDALYLAFEVSAFGDFWLDLVESGSLDELGFRLLGLSVTAPFKEIAQAVAGASSPLAERVGSANTLVNRSGVWEAETTDPDGVIGPLGERGFAPGGRTAAVVGCGGVGRAAAFGLARAGARVTLVNRGVERGEQVGSELGLPFLPLAEMDPAAFELLVNATPLGTHPTSEMPFDPQRLREGTMVVDLTYRRGEPTELVRRCRAAGARAVDGREVLLHQAVPQIRMMTGLELPLALGRRVLGLEAER